MTGNSRQFQPKRISDTNKSDLSPLILSPTRSRRNEEWIEEELLAEDDPLASNPPRPPTSSIRWNTTTTGRRATGSRDVSIETTRQQISVPTRRTADLYNPTTGPVQARYGRNPVFESAPLLSPAQNVEQKRVHWLLYVGDEKIPITLSFSDVNNDHRVDMIVHIQDKEVHFCNNGTKFTACS